MSAGVTIGEPVGTNEPINVAAEKLMILWEALGETIIDDAAEHTYEGDYHGDWTEGDGKTLAFVQLHTEMTFIKVLLALQGKLQEEVEAAMGRIREENIPATLDALDAEAGL